MAAVTWQKLSSNICQKFPLTNIFIGPGTKTKFCKSYAFCQIKTLSCNSCWKFPLSNVLYLTQLIFAIQKHFAWWKICHATAVKIFPRVMFFIWSATKFLKINAFHLTKKLSCNSWWNFLPTNVFQLTSNPVSRKQWRPSPDKNCHATAVKIFLLKNTFIQPETKF